MSNTGGVTEGVCPGHTAPSGGSGGGGSTEIVNNSPIQDVTSAQCQALPTFTGSNNEAVRTVTDNRGGTTRTYEIAKLADGKCWMLTNLKLGSTSGTITLTPADSDVASNFTLPQLTTSGSPDYDNPRAYGPVPGDTGSGATNYGYLYNFSAATAGESRTSLAADAGNAPHSICPANWRLPSGDYSGGEFGQLSVAFGSANPYSSNDLAAVDKWNYNGPFKGVLAGYRSGGFSARGSSSYLWSASAISYYDHLAFYAFFRPNLATQLSYNDRNLGFGVRCLLN